MKRSLHGRTAYAMPSFDGTTLCYETTPGTPGEPTLLFLHGMGGDLTAWDKIRLHFQSLGFPTLAIDLRGHGFTGRPKHYASYTFDNFAKDIAIVLQQEQIGTYILIGHCLGGIVSIVGISQLFLTPKATILISAGYSSSPFGKTISKRKLFQHVLVFFTKIPLRFALPTRPNYTSTWYVGTKDVDLRRLILDISHTSVQSFLATLGHLITFEGFYLLKDITIPTLILTGEHDSFFPVNVARRLSQYIQNAELVIIPKANHIIVLNNPEELCRAIETFLVNQRVSTAR